MSLNFILDLLFPKRCLSCGKFSSYLCNNCTSSIYINKVTICPVCERASIDGITHLRCQTRYTINGLISFWQYEGVVKKIIHKIKYDPFLSDSIKEIVNKLDIYSLNPEEKWIKNYSLSFKKFLKEKPILVPVPLHKSRFRWRGYNHTTLIAYALAKKWNLKVKENILIRIKKNRPQVELKGKGRIENVKDAFKVNNETMKQLNNDNFILIDDVWTTGSTLKTCATLLKRNGAQSVWGLTLAR